jgi:FMN phosphatase YigB (HAD superfamily)
MNQIERDKTPAPPFIEVFRERSIKTAVLDIDGCVLDTPSHFKNILFRLGLEVSNNCLPDIDDLPSKQVALDIEKEVYDIYYTNKKQPVLIGKQYTQALNAYHVGESDFQVTNKMKELINRYQEICYTTSPKAYEGTERLLRMFLAWNIGIVFNSHAQDSWTEVKVCYMQDLTKSQQPFPYVTTPLNKKKGVGSWLEACRKANTKPENTLGVGDNFDADIIPAIAAGYKNVVWINSRGDEIPKNFELDKDTHLYVIEHIRELEFLSGSNRVL